MCGFNACMHACMRSPINARMHSQRLTDRPTCTQTATTTHTNTCIYIWYTIFLVLAQINLCTFFRVLLVLLIASALLSEIGGWHTVLLLREAGLEGRMMLRTGV